MTPYQQFRHDVALSRRDFNRTVRDGRQEIAQARKDLRMPPGHPVRWTVATIGLALMWLGAAAFIVLTGCTTLRPIVTTDPGVGVHIVVTDRIR